MTAVIGDVWWHDSQQSSSCDIIRFDSMFVIPTKGDDCKDDSPIWLKWSIDEQLWMRCATLSWYPSVTMDKPAHISSTIKSLLDSKANPNYSYRGCTTFEATLLHSVIILMLF
jgi:hypothetical protein